MKASNGSKQHGVRKSKLSHQGADKPRTVIPMMGGLQKLIAMNDKALKIMANR